MNHMQVVGSHNSYHVEVPLEEVEAQKELLPDYINYRYSHAQLDVQLGEQKMRNLEYTLHFSLHRSHLTKYLGSMSSRTPRVATTPSP